jgi:hypothetical protein
MTTKADFAAKFRFFVFIELVKIFPTSAVSFKIELYSISFNNSSVEIYEQNGGFAAEKRGKGRVNYFF